LDSIVTSAAVATEGVNAISAVKMAKKNKHDVRRLRINSADDEVNLLTNNANVMAASLEKIIASG
jgi:hypothetical protein